VGKEDMERNEEEEQGEDAVCVEILGGGETTVSNADGHLTSRSLRKLQQIRTRFPMILLDALGTEQVVMIIIIISPRGRVKYGCYIVKVAGTSSPSPSPHFAPPLLIHCRIGVYSSRSYGVDMPLISHPIACRWEDDAQRPCHQMTLFPPSRQTHDEEFLFLPTVGR
jgi:hypothetical protein